VPGRAAAAWAAFRAFLRAAAAAATLLTVALAVLPHAVVRALAPGLTADAAAHAARLASVAAPAVAFLAMAAVTQAALTGMERFGASAASDVVYRACLIVG